MKRENTVSRILKNPVSFSGRTIVEIHFDLMHIRFGWDKEKRDYKAGPPRNQYSEDDIIDLFEQLRDASSFIFMTRVRGSEWL